MLVKVFRTEYKYYNDDDYRALLVGITDWEDITEEDVAILKQAGYTVVEQYLKPEIETTVAKLRDAFLSHQRKMEANRKKREQSEKEREQKALERKIAKAKKLLEEHGN
jgi:diphthamide biosynthesis methyltransferase